MKYFSTFSGIGGFEKGIDQAYESLQDIFPASQPEHEAENTTSVGQGRLVPKPTTRLGNPICIGYSEIDKYATQIYSEHYPKHKNYGDITTINASELPDFDLLVGGFPCQSFSIAGKRGGFADTRGTMFFELARILQAKKPRLFVFENVKGLLSHDNGQTFRTIVSTLDELGYDLQWQVLNSKNFGVPQNRERVFIIGHLRGEPRPQVFPFGESGSEPAGETIEQGISNTLTGRSASGHNRRGNYIKQLNQPKHSNDRIYGTGGVAPTINTAQGGNRQPKILSHYGHKNKSAVESDLSPTLKASSHGHEPMIIGGLQAHQTARGDGISPTLTTAMGQGGGQTPIVWSEYIKIRRLTPIECERLQGFPDNWTLKGRTKDEYGDISDTQRYKCLGNAVTVNVIQAIMEKLIKTSNHS